MTKYGVGVGEEFPVDDRPLEAGSDDETQRCGYRGGYRRGQGQGQGRGQGRGHEAWHQFRDQMRAEWRARRRAFRESRGGAAFVEELGRPNAQKLVIGGLALIGLAALVSLLTPKR